MSKKNMLIKPFTITLISAVYLVVLVGYAQFLEGRINHSSEVLASNQETVLAQSNALESLLKHMGFTGYIHNFKNAVLRGRENYTEQLKIGAAQLTTDLVAIRTLLDHPDEIKAIAAIEANFLEYHSKERLIPLNVVSDPQLIDEIVKVDDTQADEAIQFLMLSLAKRSEELKGISLAENASIQRWLYSLYFIIVIALLQSTAIVYALRESQRHIVSIDAASKHLTAIIESSPDALLEVNQQGVITTANSMAYRVLAAEQGTLVGQSVETFVPKNIAKHHHKLRNEFMNSGRTRAMDERRDLKAVRLDGQSIDVEISLNRFVVDENPLAILTIRDVTSLRLMETKANQKQRLESLGHLTAGIAHDFNNTLTTISGNAELAKMEIGNDKQIEAHMDEVIHAVSTASSLTSRLLAFGRRQTLKNTICELDKDIVAMKELLSRTLGENITLHFDIHPTVGKVNIDKAQLETAILNLCLNAKHAMPKGGKLVIRINNCDLDDIFEDEFGQVIRGRFVQVAISDSGAGISADIISRVMEPFFSTKKESHGTGLGLSMVYGFIRQSKGHMKLYSEEGSGTTVNLFIPEITSEGEDKRTEITVTNELNERDKERIENSCILVIEDDASVRKIPVSLLRKAGYKVWEAESPEAAMSVARSQEKIDLLFSDVILSSNTNGLELCLEIQKTHPETKAMLTTGYAPEVVSEQLGENHDFEILMKPYSSRTLLDAVAKALQIEQT